MKPSNEKKKQPNKSPIGPDRAMYTLATMGTSIAVGMLFFFFMGSYLDKKFETEHWSLVGVICAFVFCGYEIWKATRQFNK